MQRAVAANRCHRLLLLGTARCAANRSSCHRLVLITPASVAQSRHASTSPFHTDLSVEPVADNLIADAVSNAPIESLQSIGLGCYYTPVGWVQNFLDLIHTTTGLPWWASIGAGAIFMRACMFPLVLKIRRRSTDAINHMTKLQELMKQIQSPETVADKIGMVEELQNIQKESIRMQFRSMMTMMPSAVIFGSFFWGIRSMANAPVLSMKTGGALWFTDLTICDPTVALPAITAVTLWMVLESGGEGMVMPPGFKWLFRGMVPVTCFLVYHFPSALLCYWIASNVFALSQGLLLKNARVKEYFQLPKTAVVPHPTGSFNMAEMRKAFEKAQAISQTADEIGQRQRMGFPVTAEEMTKRKVSSSAADYRDDFRPASPLQNKAGQVGRSKRDRIRSRRGR